MSRIGSRPPTIKTRPTVTRRDTVDDRSRLNPLRARQPERPERANYRRKELHRPLSAVRPGDLDVRHIVLRRAGRSRLSLADREFEEHGRGPSLQLLRKHDQRPGRNLQIPLREPTHVVTRPFLDEP